MTRRRVEVLRSSVVCRREVLGLKQEEAAAYIGLSRDEFMKLVDAGLMPQPHEIVGTKLLLWDAEELAVHFKNLRRRGDSKQDEEEHLEFGT